jgi:site-specific DNA-methyltransferase (adenine-specific)
MGSGTTAEACINTDRQFIGFEKSPEYYKICIDRITPKSKTLDTFIDKEKVLV